MPRPQILLHLVNATTMNKRLIIIAAALLMGLPAAAQNELQSVLESVERNNISLREAAWSAKGRSYEARTGNSLEPLSVSYSSVGDAPDKVGKEGELEVSQSFDLPMLYATRSRRAKTLAQQYEAEYLALRQQVLLEAKEVYLELCVMHAMAELNAPRLAAAEHMASLFASRYETGDATVIDRNRTEFEFLLLKEELSAVQMRIIELSQRLTALNGGVPIECGYVLPSAEVVMPLEVLLQDWEENAPGLTALRLQQEAAAHDVRLSRQQALPKVELGYKCEYGSGERANGFTAGLGIPIFSNRYNVKRAQAFEQAARASAEAASVESRNTITELYMKTEYLAELLHSFGAMPETEQYMEMLGKLIEAGQISIVEYYSELDTFYKTLETRLTTDLEYRLGIARLNVIYM